MKAELMLNERHVLSENSFVEMAVWRVFPPVSESHHGFKYRLALMVKGRCVLRYDNETGKGDHRHFSGKESAYVFTTPEKLVADFQNDIVRWNNENRYP